MADSGNFWVVTLKFRYSDISFRFNDAEQAVIFAQTAGDCFAPHFSDYYTGEGSNFRVIIRYVSVVENDQKKADYDAAMNPAPN